MTTKIGISRIARALCCVAALAGVSVIPSVAMLAVPGEAHAVIGRPFTPVSYAGVARRTSRRVARRTVARTAAVTTLPAGCVPSGVYYNCGATQYQQAYDGGTVVYVEAD